MSVAALGHQLYRAPLRTALFSQGLLRAQVARGAICAVLVLSGCVPGAERGHPNEQTPHTELTESTDRELLARVSAVLHSWPEVEEKDDAFAYLDFVAARAQLGLPADAEIVGPGKQRLLISFATRPLFRFSTVLWDHPSLGPLGDVLDTRRVEVAVGTSFAFSGPGSREVWPWDVVVLRTGQPFEEIAGLLRLKGYGKADEGLLIADRRAPGLRSEPGAIPFPAAGAAGRGVIVFAGSARTARAALSGADAELTATLALLAELTGVARLTSGASGWGPSGECVVAIGLGEDAEPREGEVVVIVEGEAQADRLLFSGITQAAISANTEVVFGEAEAEGNKASVRFRSTDNFNPTRLPVENVAAPYVCP